MAFTKKSWQDHLTASFGQEDEAARASKDGLSVGGVYEATQGSLNDGDFARLHFDAYGNTMVNLAAGEEINIGTITLGSITKIGSVVGIGTVSNTVTTSGTVTGVGTISNVVTTSGTVTGVGTITNVGSLTNIGTIGTIVGMIASGTYVNISTGTVGSITNIGTLKGIDTFAGTAKTSMDTLIAGEDQTNDVLKTEGQFSYYHHLGTAGSTSGTIKAAAGFLHSVIYNTHTALGTYAIYDSVGTSATVIAIVAPGAALPPLTSIYDVKCTTGITVVSGSTCDLTFAYR